MILFVITSVSDLMLDVLALEKNRGQVVAMTDRLSTQKLLRKFGVMAFLHKQLPLDVSDRDRQFAALAMPGELGESTFLNTDLRLHEVLSIDRLKFWYDHNAENCRNLLSNLDWTRAYVSLDMNSILPWIAMELGDEVTAIKTEPFRTKEVYDFAPAMDFNEYIVDTEEDEAFLNRLGFKNVVVRKREKKEIEFPERDKLREGLTTDTVIGLLFDKRDEWQCRKWLSENAGQSVIWVFPVDDRSKDLSYWCLKPYEAYYLRPESVMISACDKIVAFRYDEKYMNGLPPIELEIVDYAGLNKVEVL